MSNPGIRTIFTYKSSRVKKFAIEDNLGEAIHIHLDNFRLDFSINSFLNFSQLIYDSLEELNLFHGYSIKSFDIYFLLLISPFLRDLISIEIKKKKLKNLQCVVRNNIGRISIRKVKDIPAFKYLYGDRAEFEKYNQFNYERQDNINRLNTLLNNIKINGYPYNNNYIISFSRQENLIRDGAHRAAVLTYLYGEEHVIDIMVFYFNKNHNVSIIKNDIGLLLKYSMNKIKPFVFNLFALLHSRLKCNQ
jgi:hypothetical protein